MAQSIIRIVIIRCRKIHCRKYLVGLISATTKSFQQRKFRNLRYNSNKHHASARPLMTSLSCRFVIDCLLLHRPTKRRKMDDPQHQTFLNIHSGQLFSIRTQASCHVLVPLSNHTMFLLCKNSKAVLLFSLVV